MSICADELTKRKVNRQRRVRLEMRHASRVRRQENRQMGFGEYSELCRLNSFPLLYH